MRSGIAAVIGSGPCGSYVALNLLRLGYAVRMYDIGSTLESFQKDKRSVQDLKSLNGNLSAYDMNDFCLINSVSNAILYPSKAKFGYSNLWGATWETDNNSQRPDYESIVAILDSDFLELPREIKKIRANGDFRFDQQRLCQVGIANMRLINQLDKKRGISAKQTRLLVSNHCMGVGTCQSGCPNSAIWNASILFDACKTYSTFSYLDDFFIDKVEPIDRRWKIFSKSELEYADEVYLCAGPIGNSRIILNSKFKSEVTLRDTSMSYLLFFNMLRGAKHNFPFGLSTISIDSIDQKGFRSQHQIYFHLQNSVSRLANRFKFPPKPLTWILRKLEHRLAIGLEYVDKRASSRIVFQESNYGFIQANVLESGYRNRTFWRFLKIAFHTGLLPLAKIPTKTGASFHLGEGDLGLNNEYEFPGLPGCKVFGTISLKELNPGPATSYALYDIAEYFLKRLNSHNHNDSGRFE